MLNKKQTAAIEIAALLVLSLGIFALLQPSLTGYISTSAKKASLNIYVTESATYDLSSTLPVELTSLSITGEAQGAVQVYLIADKEYLVYSNFAPRTTNKITGLTTQIYISEDERLKERTTNPPGTIIREGGFTGSCIETCSLTGLHQDKYKLKVLLGHNASLYLDTLTFSTPE